MRMKSEAKFYGKIKHVLHNIAESCWFRIEQRSVRGTPDILGCVNGTFVALELKKDAKEISKRGDRTRLQIHNINRIRYSGGYACFLHPDNWDDVYRDLLRISMGTFNLAEYLLTVPTYQIGQKGNLD